MNPRVVAFTGRHCRPSRANFDQTLSVSSGPALYESLNVWPNSSQFVVSVNLGNASISIARDEAAAGIKYIGMDRIRAFERTLSHASLSTIDVTQSGSG
jgi:hypothetical protein